MQEAPNPTAAKPLRTFNACMPDKELQALDAARARAHVSRSFAIREGVKLWLKAQARG